MFVERKITKALHDSEALRQFQALAGVKDLKEGIVIHWTLFFNQTKIYYVWLYWKIFAVHKTDLT